MMLTIKCGVRSINSSFRTAMKVMLGSTVYRRKKMSIKISNTINCKQKS